MTEAIQSKKRKAMVLMAICASLWSISGIFIKWISWNAFLIAGGRSLIAAAVLGVYMYVTRTKVKVCKYSLGAGLSLGVSFLCFVAANKLTTAANAIVLQYTAPIFILIISVLFLHQKIKQREIIVVCIAAIGIILFFFDQLSPGNIIGNLLAIAAGLLLAVMFVLVGLGGEDDSVRMSGILFAHFVTSIIGIPAGGILTASIVPMEIVFVLILGVAQLGIPYVLYGIASRDCPPLACSLIGMLEPLLNPVWVFFFHGELPGMFAAIGAVIVLASVSAWCLIEGKESP